MAAGRGIGPSSRLLVDRPVPADRRGIQIPDFPVESPVAGLIAENRFVRAVALALVGYSRPLESVLGPVARLVDCRRWPAIGLVVHHLGFQYSPNLVPVGLPDLDSERNPVFVPPFAGFRANCLR